MGCLALPYLYTATQRDLDELEKWAHVNLMRFNKAQVQGARPHTWVGATPWYRYRLGVEGIESSPAEKELRLLVDENLGLSR